MRECFLRRFALAAPYEGAIGIWIEAYMRIPTSTAKELRARREAGGVRCLTRPDKDNIEKCVYDALNGALFKDDKQITDGGFIKRYAREPGLRITWEVLDDG